jgi:hypothetical protein
MSDPKPKPTLGLRPCHFAVEFRIREIRQAVGRYLETDEEIPDAWVIEWATLVRLQREIDAL